MKSLKIVLVTISLILIAVALLSLGKTVSATSAPTGLGVTGLNSQGNATLNTTTNTATPSLSNLQNRAVATTTATNTVPQTGDSEDFIIYGLIAVFAVVGVVAYKKVRDYNI